MDETDYQLSLLILRKLVKDGLISLPEETKFIEKLKAYYQPKVTLMSG